MRIWIFGIMASVLFLSLFMGCSGGNFVAPAPPQEGSVSDSISRDMDSPESSSAFLGLYQIDIDTGKMTWTIEPIRKMASADVLESVDITKFMTSAPCKDCVRVFNLGIDQHGYLVMGLGIKHPFPQGDPSKEITGRNRADLHVFNVEGTLLTDLPEIITFPPGGPEFATGYLVNPDGYTANLDTLIDNVIWTGSDAHPYILHFDDYSEGNFSGTNPNGFADVLNPTGNLVMKMGSDYSIKDYKFNITPGESLSFAFAVGCTFGFTTNSYMDRFNPVYRIPQHNKKAASEIHVEVVENNLKYWEPESSATLRIEVMDINHATAYGTEIDQVSYESRVAYLSVDAPAICDTIVLSDPTPVSESGDGRKAPLMYEVNVHNERNSRQGIFPCLVKITDSYPVRSNPNPALGGADIMGPLDETQMMLSYLFEFATYQMINLEVKPCDGAFLREGITPVDMGVDGEGNSIVAYSDKQVWKYDVDFCNAEMVFADEVLQLASISRIDAHEDGRMILIGPAGNC